MEASHPAELNTSHHFPMHVKQNCLSLMSKDTAKGKLTHPKSKIILKAPISSSTEDKG